MSAGNGHDGAPSHAGSFIPTATAPSSSAPSLGSWVYGVGRSLFNLASNSLSSITSMDDRPPQRLSGLTLPPPPSSQTSYFVSAPPITVTHDHPFPTRTDLDEVAYLLRRKDLPLELVGRIMDMAGYWSICRMSTTRPIEVAANGVLPPGPRGESWVTGQEHEIDGNTELHQGLRDGPGEVWYLASAPIGCSTTDNAPPSPRRRWVRRLVIDTLSQDQGWTSTPQHYGTYDQCYSWFELCLWREGQEVEESRCRILDNVHAGQYAKEHRRILDPSHPLLQAIQPGDRVILWVRAMYPGWMNRVRRATITVFSAPYPSTL